MLLPTAMEGRSSGIRYTFFQTYFRRLMKPRQMDFEYTFWLMLQLVISPKTVYRHVSYHKQTKNQWARDDPAFVLIQCLLLLGVGVAYCVAFGQGFFESILKILMAVVIDYFLIGFAVATLSWFLANRFLRKSNYQTYHVEQQVEWFYAFDVHCNSFFPLFLVLYVLQFLMIPLLLWKSFFSGVVSSALYVVGLGYYHYMNFLGYSTLPFVQHAEVFLWPIAVIFLSLPFSILFGFNPARYTLGIYFG
eukprot:TRINITY_DN3956_c0_g1_i1.p2 TRINITY_DN3956_c0_g1~~TRINITY_DN3956_c0_g1_i1.p2  ORF type:complete len:248 (-),score=0.07 TRINITY_DN3956_c0_g1_i1:620-1363(-)